MKDSAHLTPNSAPFSPEEWDTKPLKHLVSIFGGATPSKAREDFWKGNLPWVSPKDMKRWILCDSQDHISHEAASETGLSIIPPQAVLIVVRGMILAHSFPVGIAGTELTINQDMKALVPHSMLHAPFFAYVMLSMRQAFLACVEEAGHGTKALRSEAWASLPILVPPVPIQRAIVAFLDRETAKIDALIAKQERLFELLDEKRHAVISHTVTRGIDPNAQVKDSGVRWFRAVPVHWEVKRVKHLVTLIEQGWSPEAEDRLAGDGEWGVLKAGCVNRGVFRPEQHKALPAGVGPRIEIAVRVGDLLMSRASGSRDLVGSVAIVLECPFNLMLSDKIFRLKLNRSLCSPQFLAFALRARSARDQIEQAISGAEGLANNIGMNSVREIVVALPPLTEQRHIVDTLLHTQSTAARALELVGITIDCLKERRSALITAAVTGQIDMREHTGEEVVT